MRLICPNCDAQYEVDAAMIPASGRDVQCSNCGKTWFQGPNETVSVKAPETEPESEEIEEPATDVATDRSGDGLGDEAAAFFGKAPADAEPETAESEQLTADEVDQSEANEEPARSADPQLKAC